MAWCPRWSTSAPSSTSAAWTGSSTCRSCRGSTSTIPRRWSRWATRSRSRCSTSTSTRSGSACRSRPPRPTPGRSSPTPTRWASSSTAGSPSSCPSAAFVQVGDGIEGLVHISEMAGHHVDLPEQVVTPGEELWVKIIDIDLQRRRISLSIKQAAEGGEVSEEYREAFGEHAYDEQGNYIGYDYGGDRVHPRDRGAGGLGRVRGRARQPTRGNGASGGRRASGGPRGPRGRGSGRRGSGGPRGACGRSSGTVTGGLTSGPGGRSPFRSGVVLSGRPRPGCQFGHEPSRRGRASWCTTRRRQHERAPSRHPSARSRVRAVWPTTARVDLTSGA